MLEDTSINSTKLLRLFRTLSSKEVRLLGDWVRSPFFNKSGKVVELFDMIRQYHPGFRKKIFKSDVINTLSFNPGRSEKGNIHPEEEKMLRNTMHKLTACILEFMIWQKQQEDTVRNQALLADSLMVRKLYDDVGTLLIKTRKNQDAIPFRNSEYYFNEYLLNQARFFTSIILQNRAVNAGLQEVIDNLRVSFLSNLLLYYCAAVNREEVLKVKYQYPLMDAILRHLSKSEDTKIPVIGGNYYVLMLLKNRKSDFHYQALKKLIFTKSHFFTAKDLRQFFGFMLNFCSREVRKGRMDYAVEKHELYTHSLPLGIWVAGLHFSPHHFMRIIDNALVLGKSEWAVSFLETYQNKLGPGYQDVIPNMAKAFVAYFSGNYDEAQSSLLMVDDSEDFFYRMDYKKLQIQIYFDADDFTAQNFERHPIHSSIEAFRHYLSPERRKNMSESIREANLRFVNLTRRILNLKYKKLNKLPVKAGKVEKIRKAVKSAPLLERRNWLLQKLTAFEIDAKS